MASIADSSTSLEAMKSANDDFVELILKLKSLLNGKEPVTFNMGKYSITVQSVLDLISNYKDGKFDELYLGGQGVGKKVKLSVDANGNLCVTDTDGYKVSVSCSKIISATIQQCYAKYVTAKDVRISSLEGRTSVKGGSVKFSNMSFENLKVNNLEAQKVKTNVLNVESALNCDGILLTGVRKFAPQFVRRMFYNNNSPIDNAANSVVIENNVWNMNAGGGKLSPLDFGFSQAENPTQLKATSAVPDIIQICGNNKFSDFATRSQVFFKTYKQAMTVPGNVAAYVSAPNSDSYYDIAFEGSNYSFAALMAFPTGGFSSTLTEKGALYLTSFSANDIGKEIYYQTYDQDWYIYRTMILAYSSATAKIPAVGFGAYTKIPKYSCVRFIVGCTDETKTEGSSSSRTVTYSLDLS